MADSPRIGAERRWFGRAGVVLLLTAFVLFIHYLNESARPGSVGILWLIALVIFGAGLFLEKLSRPWPGRAMVTAGLAAFYGTAFATIYFTHLRLIGQPLVGAAWILVVAIAVVWFAERYQAPITTFFAIILSAYITMLQPVLLATLISDLVLVGVGGWFLVRHGNALLAFATLTAAYASYAMWWTYHDAGTDFARYLQLGEFWQTCVLFAVSWIIIIVCSLSTPKERLAPELRLALISFDHALFFSLVVFLLPPMYTHWLSGFCIILGTAMIGTAAFSGIRDPFFWPPGSRQGLLVVALGLMTLVCGPSLVLIAAVVSALLLVTAKAMSEWRAKTLLLLAGALALTATLLAFGPIQNNGEHERTIGFLTGLIFVWEAFGAVRAMISGPARAWAGFYFSTLGGILWLLTALYCVPAVYQPPLLAVAGLALVFVSGFSQVAGHSQVGSALVLAAQILWLSQIGSFVRPWWSPVVVIAATLFLSGWWSRRPQTLVPALGRKTVMILAAVGLVSVLFFWLAPSLSPRSWLVTAAILAIAALLWGLASRNQALAVLGQCFAMVCLYEFLIQIFWNPPLRPLHALVPAIMFLVLAVILDPSREQRDETFRWVAPFYRGLAALVIAAWTATYWPSDLRFFTLELCGFILLIWMRVRYEPVTLFSSVVFSSAAVLIAWTTRTGARGFHLADLIAFALLLGQQQLSKRLLTGVARSPYVQSPVMVIGIVTLWHWVSLWSEHHFGPFSLTISWAFLGLVVFLIGLIFREPTYRWLGWSLMILAAVRVWMFDLRTAGTLQSSLDLAVTGVTMLAAAFFRMARPGDKAVSA